MDHRQPKLHLTRAKTTRETKRDRGLCCAIGFSTTSKLCGALSKNNKEGKEKAAKTAKASDEAWIPNSRITLCLSMSNKVKFCQRLIRLFVHYVALVGSTTPPSRDCQLWPHRVPLQNPNARATGGTMCFPGLPMSSTKSTHWRMFV